MAKLLGLAITVAVVIAASLVPASVAQTTHVVGDELGWIVPPGGPIAYETWAKNETFVVGDILLFNFTTGDQDVARVTKDAYDSCDATNPIFLLTTGPATVTLNSTGEYYFIGTMDRHCFLGQKLAINVTGTSSGPTSSPSPPPPPSKVPAPAPPTARGPVTYFVGDDLGWIVPPGGPIAYQTWAYNKTFLVGDSLVFNFTTGQQDVARVTKEAFDSCNSTNPIFLETTGPATVALDSVGEYYFIGTMDRHCFLGQKLAINVTAASSGPTPSPTSPPKAPAPATPRGPVTYIVGDDLGWLVPPGGPIAYATWAYGKTFLVGDILVFNFKNETQDVAVVSKQAYETCNTSNTISVFTVSPVSYTLTATGEYFFTSTYARHCALGQRLDINVTGTATTAPSPSTSGSPPSTTAPSPSSSGSPPSTTTPSAPSPSGGSSGVAPGPSSSAPQTKALLGYSLSLFSIIAALLY